MKKIFTILVLSFIAVCGFSQTYTRALYLKDKGQRMNGNDVKQLQQKLWDLGFTEVGEADGWFGPATETALIEFQKTMGLEVDGVMGKQSFKCLYDTSNSLLNSYRNKLVELNKLRHQKYEKSVSISCYKYCFSGMAYYSGEKLKYAGIGEEGSDIMVFYNIGSNEKILTFYGSRDPDDLSSSTYYYNGKRWYEITNGNFTTPAYDPEDSIDHLNSLIECANCPYPEE